MLKRNQSNIYKTKSVILSPETVLRIGPIFKSEVENLVYKNTNYLFGETLPEEHLTKRFLSLGIFNEENQLTGVVCLDDHPNVPVIPPWEWYHWLFNLYGLSDITTMNSAWIHYAVWNRNYTYFFLKPILQNLFENNDNLKFIMMVCPPGIHRLDFIEDLATRVCPIGYPNPKQVLSLYMLKRETFIANYTIRRAVEEDNDDLVSIIPRKCEEYYGPYYISELLSLEDSTREIIVAEYQHNAVSVLCLNEEVNYEMLNNEFELVPYNGLRKPDEDDEIGTTYSNPLLGTPGMEDEVESITPFVMQNDTHSETMPEHSDSIESEDEYSLMNLSSTLLLDFLYEDTAEVEDEEKKFVDSDISVDSGYSAVLLNEEYEDHVYNDDKRDSAYSLAIRGHRQSKPPEAPVIPTFHGEPNAFTLEICTALPEHENSLFELFQAAFECFPDRDYCVVSFPPDSPPSFIVRHFGRVSPRPNSAFNHELYVLHKNSILGALSSRFAVADDKYRIKELCSTLRKPTMVEDLFRDAVENPRSILRAFVFLCEQQIIGFALVTEEDDQQYLELNYDVENWVHCKYNKFGTSGSLEIVCISPIFQRHEPYFLRELHRLSDFNIIFYRLKKFEYFNSHKVTPLPNVLQNLAPAIPMPRIEYDQKIIDDFPFPAALLKRHPPFALYVSCPRLTSAPRIEINARMVVVGAGATATAFLETLLLGENTRCLVTFTSVTVVSPHGIHFHKPPSKVREMVFVKNGIDRRHMDGVCLRTNVHIVTGVMSAINRQDKYITLNDDSFLPYDYLFLLCGQQFQKPPEKKEIGRRRSDFPSNVFIINTEADAANAFTALRNMDISRRVGTMVIFGHYLEALCCITALLEFGVTGQKIVYIDPSPSHNPNAGIHDHLTEYFNNRLVEMTVVDEMLQQGITIYQDYNFVEWYHHPEMSYIISARFESKYKYIDIDLSALFMYHGKAVSTRTFQAITKAGLVFNGYLVIDKDFTTNDPNIYGAGPLTMYSMKYHEEHHMHKYFNGEEIGAKLGRQLRRKLIPRQFWDYASRKPVRHMPIVQYCKFPGGLHYLHVFKPGKPIPLDVAMNKSTYGNVLITGDCRKLRHKGYFRLHLNRYNTVETITCLAKYEFIAQNLVMLYGKHESLLNNLHLRYEMNMIDDLFAYFNEPWTCALYHNRFQELLEELNELFHITTISEDESLLNALKKMFEENDWHPLNKFQTDEMEELCRDSGLFQVLEKKVLIFLHDHYMYLPMYAHQMLIRWIINQISASPLFLKTNFLSKTMTAEAADYLKKLGWYFKQDSDLLMTESGDLEIK